MDIVTILILVFTLMTFGGGLGLHILLTERKYQKLDAEFDEPQAPNRSPGLVVDSKNIPKPTVGKPGSTERIAQALDIMLQANEHLQTHTLRN